MWDAGQPNSSGRLFYELEEGVNQGSGWGLWLGRSIGITSRWMKGAKGKKKQDTPMLDCCSQNRLPRTTSLRVLGWEPRGTVFRKSFERPPGSDKAGF